MVVCRLGATQQIYEIPEHLTASPTDTGSHNSLRCVGSLCKVRNDMKGKFLVS